MEAHPPRPEVEFIVCTHRLALAALQQRGWLARLRAMGVQVIVDTCVVVTPIVRARGGVLMTNSGKFAHYSPGNIGLQVVYGSLEAVSYTHLDVYKRQVLDLLGEGRDLSGANLTGISLVGLDLSGAPLRGVDLTDADLSQVNLSGAVLREATLSRACLSQANLADADLRQCRMERAVLQLSLIHI